MLRRPLVTAAVVGGTAYYAGKRRAQGQAHEAAQDAQIAEMQQQTQQQPVYAPPPVPAPTAAYAPAPAASPPGLGDQLAQLAKLHETGGLSDEEYAAAKAKLLA
jgi:hypothetical protein